jgi:hypothetical protein
MDDNVERIVSSFPPFVGLAGLAQAWLAPLPSSRKSSKLQSQQLASSSSRLLLSICISALYFTCSRRHPSCMHPCRHASAAYIHACMHPCRHTFAACTHACKPSLPAHATCIHTPPCMHVLPSSSHASTMHIHPHCVHACTCTPSDAMHACIT